MTLKIYTNDYQMIQDIYDLQLNRIPNPSKYKYYHELKHHSLCYQFVRVHFQRDRLRAFYFVYDTVKALGLQPLIKEYDTIKALGLQPLIKL